MTAATITGTGTGLAAPGGAAGRALRDVVVLARRNLLHIAREPMQLSDVTIQPVLFTLLFVYVFGAGIPVSGGSYKDFAIAGLLAMNLTTSTPGTAVGLATDLATGTMTRFRTLPMWRPAVLVGRSIADLLTALLCGAIVLLTGLAIGWRPGNGPLPVLAGLGVALLFSFAMTWAVACLGLVAKSAETALSIGFVVIFPLAFVSNALVPTGPMPGWLRTIADWNPVSAVTAAARDLWGNPNPVASHAWPMQHPVAAAVLWSVAIMAVAGPLAVGIFRRRTAD